jgi:serine/threonine protein kinase
MEQVFGHYRLLKEIGRGSNAKVYSARFEDQVVAIKIFDVEHKNPEDSSTLKRFLIVNFLLFGSYNIQIS